MKRQPLSQCRYAYEERREVTGQCTGDEAPDRGIRVNGFHSGRVRLLRDWVQLLLFLLSEMTLHTVRAELVEI